MVLHMVQQMVLYIVLSQLILSPSHIDFLTLFVPYCTVYIKGTVA
jgi:hypothetical protein